MGVLAELFIEYTDCPSGQGYIENDEINVVSTHDQVIFNKILTNQNRFSMAMFILVVYFHVKRSIENKCTNILMQWVKFSILLVFMVIKISISILTKFSKKEEEHLMPVIEQAMEVLRNHIKNSWEINPRKR